MPVRTRRGGRSAEETGIMVRVSSLRQVPDGTSSETVSPLAALKDARPLKLETLDPAQIQQVRDR